MIFKPYQAFVFDLDGTILDTVLDIQSAVNFALTKYSLPTHTREEIISYIGNGSNKMIQRALGPAHQDLFDPVFKTYYDRYDHYFMEKTKPFAGIVEALTYAKSQGIALFVYTNKPDRIAKNLIDHSFGTGFFTKVIGIPLGGIIKPDPKAYLDGIKEYGFDLDRQAYFGDSDTDIETAYNIGLSHIYSVSWGYKTKAFLESFRLKPTAILDDPLAIKDVVDGKI